MPRIAPVTGKSDVPAEYHGVVDNVMKVFGAVRGPFSVMLYSPKLGERVLPLVTFFREGSVVEAKLRSHAILAAVREREAAYGPPRSAPRGAPACRSPRSTCCGPRAMPLRFPRTSGT
jgi:hypothetical protein